MKKVSLIKKGVLCCAFALCVAMAGGNDLTAVQAEEVGEVIMENNVGEDVTVSEVGEEPEVLTETFGMLTYKVIIDGTIAITDCDTSAVTVEIPETIDGMSVVIIDYKAFENCTNLTELVIPNSVAYIGNYAFSGCTNLSKIAIPEGITKIGYGLFENCSSLTEIQIPEDVTSIGDDAFAACCSLTEIDIPQNVTDIGSGAFADCSSLTEIDIPQNVTYIGSWAFDGCSSLTKIVIPEGVTAIGDSFFKNCSSITEITLPEKCSTMGSHVFEGCSSLKKVIVPEGVTNIKASTFSGCTNLNIVVIPESVKSIGQYAFGDCSSLAEIVLPEGVTSIEARAFSGCTNLNTAVIPESVSEIGQEAFSGCSTLKEVELPEGVTSVGARTFSGCTNLNTVVIPESVNVIGSCAFENCSSLKEVVLPNNVSTLNARTFMGCSSLKKITLPQNLIEIVDGDFSEGVFANCSNLEEIVIPDKVTKIGSWAFDGCSNLKTVTMSDAVTTIGRNAFYNCSSLEEIVLSKNVSVLEEATFYNCSSLKKVVLPENLITISGAIGTEGVFTNCTSLEEIIIPEHVTEIGKFAFSKCSSLKEIVIPKNVSKIGMEAFSYCSSVEKVTIQGGVETIGTGAFRSLSNLKEITISGDIQISFGGPHLEKITFAEGVTSVNLGDWDINSCDVYIPKSATSVSGIKSSAIIYGYTGSEAEAYAERTGTKFIPLDVPMETYIVSTGAELEAAIGSNRRIILKDGTYDLTWSTINSVASLIIEAENEGKAEIVDPSSTSPVIRISNSSDVQIKGLILGHESARGNDEIGDDPCGAMSEAYVIEIRFSKDISIENCDLYGCGLEGIRCASVQGLNVENCVIRDCKSYAFNEYEDWSNTGKDIRIANCIISGNAYEEKYFGYSLIRATEETVFENCIIFNNGNKALSTFKGEPIELEMNNCTFYDNAFEGKTPKAYGICLNGITWQVDGEELRIGYPLTMEDGTVIESDKGYILNYSDSSLPWKNYTDKKIVLAEGVKYEVKLGDVVEEWQKEPTLYVYERGIMTGKGTLANGDVKFDPNAPLTRPEFAQILFAEEGKPAITTDKDFNDLVAGEWYVNAVLWAAENGIVSGYTNGAFGVADNITREQLALMLYKYAQLKGYDTTASTELDKFADAGTASSWAVPSLKWAVANGVLSGAGENLKPTATATRAECAAMIRTFMTKLEAE